VPASSIALYQQADNQHEALARAHMPMVRRVALHLKVRIPPLMELDELIQVGMVGLVEAARAYDPSRGIDFENFALSRIRGAMLDELRRLSSSTRSSLAFRKEESQASRSLTASLGRPPTHAELAEAMGTSLDEFHRQRGNAHSTTIHPFDSVNDEVLDLPADPEKQPDALLEKAQLIEGLVAAIDSLDERSRMVLSLYYVETLSLRDIGEIMSVSESRVSQILTATVKKLRKKLDLE
jgi:RNA polymerase sigma factor for flagellar operon FliA